MPFFSKSSRKEKSPASPPPTTDNSLRDEKLRQIQEENRALQMAKQLSFSAQLAHGSQTAKISNFQNVKELYGRIADSLNIAVSEILYCTLNTPKVNMEKLLGGQIGLEDLIFAHCKKKESKTIRLTKDAPALGLTITDNGNGYAFIKRVRADSVASKYKDVVVGDHIAGINELDVVGHRHFEVAKILREIGEGETFTLTLHEPIRGGFDAIAPRQSKNASSKNSDTLGTGRATLRLRSKGPAVVEEAPTWEGKAIAKIDDLLERFIGIRDEELANTLIDLGKNLDNPSDYALAVDSQLGDFEFPDEFVFDLWGAINDAKAGRI